VNAFRLEIVSPDTAYPARDVAALDVPAAGGRLSVLARHQPLVCLLEAGTVRLRSADGVVEEWTIEGGSLRVASDMVTLLVRRLTPVSAA
jgi:F-type H+-transporting ATPase subunit epsilon